MTKIKKAVGAILMPYWRIGGERAVAPVPALLTRVQTDGSYGRLGARKAFILTVPDGATASQMLQSTARNPTEAEWDSVATGLEFAIHQNTEMIGLENDNLGVIHGLMFPTNPLRHKYARHYRAKILGLTRQTLWTGVRWIPRAINRADDLFH
jgi:hypothetical protein